VTPLAIITGLAAEARIADAPNAAVIIGAGRSEKLAADLETAIAQGARRLLSFGVAGALAPALRPGDLIVAAGVIDRGRRMACDPDWREAMIEALARSSLRAKPDERHAFALRSNDGWGGIADAADLVGVDAPVANLKAKAALFAATGAAAVDMESAIVARAATRHGLPFAVLRIIADPAHRPLPPAALVAMRADGGVDLAAMLGALARRPGQLPALVRLGLDSRRAFAGLVRARALLGARFASVDLGDL
jgi:adenosylhomocysteine nucleosidase